MTKRPVGKVTKLNVGFTSNFLSSSLATVYRTSADRGFAAVTSADLSQSSKRA